MPENSKVEKISLEKTVPFFVSTGLGMEDETALEIQEVWSELLNLDGRPHAFALQELLIEKGGVGFSAPLHLGLQLNFFLKVPHRILLRLKEFRCRDFPKLFAEAKKVPLLEYLETKSWQLEVAASKSRLNHEGRIQETLEKAWGLKANSKEPGPKIFVRFFDDLCSISLDTSGEHLHFRGGNLFKGDAPLRETLAAFCLRKMIGDLSAQEIAKIRWVDPMMGSGTFLLELAEMFQVNSQRHFSFQDWKKTPKILKSDLWFKNYVARPRLSLTLLGMDRDVKMINVAQQNFASRGLELPSFEVQDIFAKSSGSVVAQDPTWLILNPPYGERMETEFSPGQLLEALIRKWTPQKVGILFSKRQAALAPTLVLGLKRTQVFSVSNGGIACDFMIWQQN